MEDCKFPHRIKGQYYVNGKMLFWYIPPEMIPMLQQFEMFEDDCIVPAYPKSGQTWLLEMVYLVMHNADLDKANTTESYKRIPWLDNCKPWLNYTPETAIAEYNQAPRPRLFKIHANLQFLPEQIWEKKIKTIITMRNPKDVVVSYYHFYQANEGLGNYKASWDTFFEMFMAGEVLYGSWFDYVLEWWNKARKCDHVLFLKYEDMVKDHPGTIKRISEFLGKSLSEEQIQKVQAHTSFNAMKNNPMTNFSQVDVIDQSISPFYRKGKVGDWKNYFSEEQSKRVDQVYKEKIVPAGLQFDFE